MKSLDGRIISWETKVGRILLFSLLLQLALEPTLSLILSVPHLRLVNHLQTHFHPQLQQTRLVKKVHHLVLLVLHHLLLLLILLPLGFRPMQILLGPQHQQHLPCLVNQRQRLVLLHLLLVHQSRHLVLELQHLFLAQHQLREQHQHSTLV